jgi:hypothetical protein
LAYWSFLVGWSWWFVARASQRLALSPLESICSSIRPKGHPFSSSLRDVAISALSRSVDPPSYAWATPLPRKIEPPLNLLTASPSNATTTQPRFALLIALRRDGTRPTRSRKFQIDHFHPEPPVWLGNGEASSLRREWTAAKET